MRDPVGGVLRLLWLAVGAGSALALRAGGPALLSRFVRLMPLQLLVQADRRRSEVRRG